MPRKTQRITVGLTEEVGAQIRRLAEKRGLFLSEVIAELVEEGLKRPPPKKAKRRYTRKVIQEKASE